MSRDLIKGGQGRTGKETMHSALAICVALLLGLAVAICAVARALSLISPKFFAHTERQGWVMVAGCCAAGALVGIACYWVGWRMRGGDERGGENGESKEE